MQVALLLISYWSTYPTFAHWPSNTQTSEMPLAPDGLPGRTRVMEPKIAHRYQEGRFFGTQRTNKLQNISDDDTESCCHVHALRCYHDAVAPDVLLVLKASCCKDAVEFAFVWQNCSYCPKWKSFIGSSGIQLTGFFFRPLF